MTDVRVLPDAEAVAAEAASAVASWLDETPRLGLAGGSTPSAMYDRLRGLGVEWRRVTLWQGDERWVAADHSDSNQRMARHHLGAGAAAWLTPDYPSEGPVHAAALHDVALRRSLGDDAGVLLLGMGADGHTLSLFPNDGAVTETGPWYVATFVDALQDWRLTATLPLVERARRLVFLVTGSAKAETLARVLGGEALPAATVAGAGPPVTWFVDAKAAASL